MNLKGFGFHLAYLYLLQVLAELGTFLPGAAEFRGTWWVADVVRWGTPILIRGQVSLA